MYLVAYPLMDCTVDSTKCDGPSDQVTRLIKGNDSIIIFSKFKVAHRLVPPQKIKLHAFLCLLGIRHKSSCDANKCGPMNDFAIKSSSLHLFSITKISESRQNRLLTFLKCGSSRMQGGHHGAKKSINTEP